MKSKIVKREEKKEIEYPCLMENKELGYIVLFNSPQRGTVVSVGDCKVWRLGEFCAEFMMGCFTPFHGEIILSIGETE